MRPPRRGREIGGGQTNNGTRIDEMFGETGLVVLATVTFLAAVVNGGLGYGFSSITVPVALIFYANRILNPAFVLVEVVLNGYILFINRRSVPLVWKRVLP